MTAHAERWRQRELAWTERVAAVGVERAIYNIGHTSEDFDAVTRQQHAAIWPLFIQRVTDQDVNALDYGCGYGRWTPQIAAAVRGVTLGVDPTPEMIDEARRRPGHPNASYAVMHRGAIPTHMVPRGGFGVLWCCLSLSTILDEELLSDVLGQVARTLSERALIFLIDNTAGRSGRPVISPYSVSRTVDEYHDLASRFLSADDLTPLGVYEDLGETITVMAGRRSAR